MSYLVPGKKKPGSSSLESSRASLADDSDDSEHELLPEGNENHLFFYRSKHF